MARPLGRATVALGAGSRREARPRQRGQLVLLQVDPDLDRPSLRAYELDGESYAEVAHVTGADTFRAGKPFGVEIVPDRLVAKLRRR